MPETPARVSFFRSFAGSNPFYLISACCMLAGCVALTNSLSWWSIPTSRLLVLFATLNIYEAALIGLAAFLILGRGLRRDGMLLVMLEAFFLIDITFLNAEISTRHSWLGVELAGFSFLAAIVKLIAILRILGIRRLPAQGVFILIQIATILALPLIFSRNSGGYVSPRAFYTAWWIVGLMPAVYEVLKNWLPAIEAQHASSRAMTAYIVLPWLSLAAHLGILHYVYDVPFYGAMAAPALLALAMVLKYAVPGGMMPRKDILVLRMLLPLAAIFVSASSPAELTLLLGRSGHFAITTLRLTLIMAYVEVIYSFFWNYSIFAMLVGGATLLTYSYGPSVSQIATSTQSSWDWTTRLAWRLAPTTQTSWGAILVIASFIFLGLGAVVSLRRTIAPTNPD